MSKRPRGRVPVYSDSLSQRVIRHVSILEAYKLAEQNGYQWIDNNDPRMGLSVRTVSIPLRPQIAVTITATELLINAGLSGASAPRRDEVKQKIAHYNDTGLMDNIIPCSLEESQSLMMRYCTWPRERQYHERN